ncbi:hypothetical protein E4656_07800 [Natronospirillum operosum]|uniref:PNPLA domain-containing protein n=1 Tax=Natronospirillum operosum TaxID=2759953 RepID=A0A4Z0WF63_9GAMM|nr:patatin-like phospholipase family protein [Natronospirillum operosum]TGG94072.1 hypothetical protein E4656_07800 [Natronospirillum operosum]
MITLVAHSHSTDWRRMTRLLGLLLVFLCWLPALALASERPRVGLVLGGGGAKGLAHVGVLQYLEEQQVPVDFIVGTSMGAIAGGLYVQGNTSEELVEIVINTPWQEIFSDRTRRPLLPPRRRAEQLELPLMGSVGIGLTGPQFPLGLLQGQRLMPTLRAYGAQTPVPHHFDDFAVPFRAIGVNIETGNPVVLDEGDINLAMRASMAIPGIFQPVVWDDLALVDGGVVNNLPIDVALEMGADILIVVDVVGNLKAQEELTSPLSIIEQALNINMKQHQWLQIERMREHDILVQPGITEAGLTAFDFDKGLAAIQVGYTAAVLHAEQIAALAVDDDTWASYRERLSAQKQTLEPQFFDLDNRSRVPRELLWATMTSAPDETFQLEELEQDLSRLYGLGYFDHVDYQPVEEEDGTRGARITALPNSTGPGYLRFGLALEEGFANYSRYVAAASYLQTEVTDAGTEWQVDAQVGQEALLSASLWQPLRRDARFYMTPRVSLQRKNVNLYDGTGEPEGQYRMARFGGEFSLGYNWRNQMDLQLGYAAGVGNTRIQSPGPQAPPEESFSTSVVRLTGTVDSLDSIVLPRRGQLLETRYEVSLPELGADADYHSLSLRHLGAVTWRRNTLFAGGRLGTVLSGDLPYYEAFQLGGLMRLSGYNPQELRGQVLLHGQFGYLRQLNDLTGLGDLPLFVGGAAETGQVWTDTDAFDLHDLTVGGTALMAVDTPVGMVIGAWGYNSDDRMAIMLSLGQPF